MNVDLSPDSLNYSIWALSGFSFRPTLKTRWEIVMDQSEMAAVIGKGSCDKAVTFSLHNQTRIPSYTALNNLSFILVRVSISPFFSPLPSTLILYSLLYYSHLLWDIIIHIMFLRTLLLSSWALLLYPLSLHAQTPGSINVVGQTLVSAMMVSNGAESCVERWLNVV